MARKLVRTEAAPASARRTDHATFSGFPWPAKLIGPILLALPPLLYFLNLGEPQLLGVFYAIVFILAAIVFASWPALEAAPTRGLGFALVAFAVVAGGAAAFPLVRSIFPGEPVAEASLSKRTGPKALPAVAAGPHHLVVHATFEESGRDVNAGYVLRVAAGAQQDDIEGRFQSRHSRGRVGRNSVDVIKVPREWNRHEVTLASAAPTVSLIKADAGLGDAIEVRLYPALPRWMVAVGAALLALLAAAFAARVPSRDARMFYIGGIATLLLTGVIGSAWAWLGEPLLPLIGASFAGILGGWVVGRILVKVAPALPWAATS